MGKRLKHVKENDLAHGEFQRWCEDEAKVPYRQANRFMKVVDEVPIEKMTTSSHLGLNALYEIATLPPAERDQPHTIPSSGETKTVDEMTVRELREVKQALKVAREENVVTIRHRCRIYLMVYLYYMKSQRSSRNPNLTATILSRDRKRR
ncbi:DUF3102 domain-containing protein [Alkalihalobacillus sp. LMS6]|nr:DUF3102 domain-containing protein [Alkalihalobacillus sp. LMS6]